MKDIAMNDVLAKLFARIGLPLMRVCWTDHKRGQSGRGSWCNIPYAEAASWAQSGNRHHAGISHWVQSNSEL